MPQPVYADYWTHGFKIDCMPELGLLEVTYKKYHGEQAWRYAEENPDKLLLKYGIHLFDNMVSFEADDSTPKEIKSYKTSCLLGNNKIDVIISPDGPTLGGSVDWHGCERFSNITMYDNGELLIDKLVSEDCGSDNALRSVIIEPAASNKMSFLRIIYEQMSRVHIEDYWYEKSKIVPITNDAFYKDKALDEN